MNQTSDCVLTHPVFSKDLRNSGLSNTTITKAGLHIMNRAESKLYLGYNPRSDCLSFPYHGANGYMRLKPENPLIKEDKPRKYLAPQNRGNHLYLPHPSLMPEEILRDPSKYLILTEGEKKTLKGVQEGFFIIGMPGVFCWKERKGKTSIPVAEFNLIKWRNRVVYIIFDSDAADNHNIVMAEEQLFDHILKLAGYPVIGRIPKPTGQDIERFKGKFGIDDLLVARGPEALREVMQKAKPLPKLYFPKGNFKPALVSHELQRRFVFMKFIDCDAEEGQLYVYVNGVYKKAANVEKEAQGLLGIDTSRRRVKDAVYTLQNAVSKYNKLINDPQLVINCRSGLLDVPSGTLKPHTPAYLSSIQLPVAWNPDARCERLDLFLQEVLPPDCVEFIDEIIGYLLVPDIRFKKFFILLGSGDNGKSVFLSLVKRLLGAWNCSQIALQELVENRFAVAGLEDKLVNIFDDINAEALKNTGYIKMLTGSQDGMIKIEKKHRNPYQIRLNARMIFSANQMPRANDYSPAWYERLVIIPFANEFTSKAKNIDRELLSKITTPTALQRLFARGVKGAQKLYRRSGFKVPESVKKQLNLYRMQNDNVMAFLSECCQVGNGERIKRSMLYRFYKDCCYDDGVHPVSKRKFYDCIRTNLRSVIEIKINGFPYFSGIGIEPSQKIVCFGGRNEYL